MTYDSQIGTSIWSKNDSNTPFVAAYYARFKDLNLACDETKTKSNFVAIKVGEGARTLKTEIAVFVTLTRLTASIVQCTDGRNVTRSNQGTRTHNSSEKRLKSRLYLTTNLHVRPGIG